ncbi:hypothetical protein OIE43_38460 [Streptomyces pseudovenezuelae]|uniref:hypothetical protein n=1 Tax=Streptomyces pseudovenezuelae TaxID=67350 RepID=UPI002E308FB9|nr:hypothetical protein [Streptomyces pseudovenezuelae]
MRRFWVDDACQRLEYTGLPAPEVRDQQLSRSHHTITADNTNGKQRICRKATKGCAAWI